MQTSEPEREETLRSALDFRERVMAAATFSIAVIDSEGNIVLVNRAAAEVCGSEIQEVIGRSLYACIAPDDVVRVTELVKTTLAHGLPVSNAECEVLRREGLTRTLRFSLQSLTLESGERGLVGTAEDVTESKESEASLRRALAEVERLKNRLQAENLYLKEEVKLNHNFGGIVGESAALKKALHLVERVAATGGAVLILGETGTGKELFARAVHDLSARKDGPFIKVDCGATPPGLIESELFGREKGAGAIKRRTGRFELADGGTIFLDEIGDFPLDLQAKLLRVMQEGAFERVGGMRTIKTDARVVAATRRDLSQRIQSGAFREDLYHRLAAFPILLPPLRERPEDIPLLALHFVKKYSAGLDKKIESVPQRLIEALQAYHFPGNVCELENIIERALIISTGPTLQMDVSFISPRQGAPEPEEPQTLEEVERSHIARSLATCNWRIEGPQGAAKRLGLHPSTLRSRMRKLNITRP